MDEHLSKALDHVTGALQDVTDIFKKLAGPLADEFGQMLGDKAYEYRMQNAAKIFLRTKKMLADAGINPNTIPPRFFLPALQAASVEDSDTLQERWAALLANASDPTEATPVLPSFVEALKELTPEQALFLDRVYTKVTMNGKLAPFLKESGFRLGDFNSALQMLGEGRPLQEIFANEPFRHHATLLFDDLVGLGVLNRVLFDDDSLRNIGNRAVNVRSQNQLMNLLKVENALYLTPFGFAFISACRAPAVAKDSGDELQTSLY